MTARLDTYIPDKADARDRSYGAIARTRADELPRKMDMRRHMTPVEDQGRLGTCVPNALVGAIEYLYARKLRRWPCLKPRDYSRLFVYYWARYLDGIEGDDGSRPRTAIKALKTFGVCKEKLWRYDQLKWSQKPPPRIMQKALRHRVDDYWRVNDRTEMLRALADGLPVTFGLVLYESFDKVGKDGIVPMPGKDERIIGRHAMLACGFLGGGSNVVVRNSWGNSWGDGGYCYMPIEYFEIGTETPDLGVERTVRVTDCWVIREA